MVVNNNSFSSQGSGGQSPTFGKIGGVLNFNKQTPAPNTSTGPDTSVYTPPPTSFGAVKSQQTPDGTTTTYHAPTPGLVNSPTSQAGTTPATTPANPTTPGMIQGQQTSGQIPNQQSGQPGFYENQIQNLQNQYAPILGTANAMPGTYGNYGANVANFNSAALTAKEAAPLSGLEASQPQGFNYQQNVVNPLTGQQGGNAAGGPGSTAATGGIAEGQFAAGQTYAQNQAILGKVTSQIPGLQQAIQSDNFNPTSITGINAIDNWAKGNLSDSSIPKVQGSLNDIIGGLSQVLGVPSSGGSDFRLQFAGSIVNALQGGQSIEDAINFAVNQATSGNQGYLKGSEGASSTANSSNSSSGNFSQQNGKWVYNQ